MNNKKPRILLFDLETSPLEGSAWGAFEQNLLRVTKESEILSIAWKWFGEGKTQVLSRRKYKKEKDLVKVLWKLLDEADIAIGHNEDKFDIKVANARIAKHNMKPYSPLKTVDTLKVANSKFKFYSHSLNNLAKIFGLGSKVKTGGLDLWFDVLEGKIKSWHIMEKYNKGDVDLLDAVYKKIAPWMNHSPLKKLDLQCPIPGCGSTHVTNQGSRPTTAGRKVRYQCQDCGHWFTGKAPKKEE